MNSVKIALVKAENRSDSKSRRSGWMSERRSGGYGVPLGVALLCEPGLDVAPGKEGDIKVLNCLDLLDSAI